MGIPPTTWQQALPPAREPSGVCSASAKLRKPLIQALGDLTGHPAAQEGVWKRGGMDSSCLIAGERERKGGVAELDQRCLNLLFGETPLFLLTTEGVYSKLATKSSVLSCNMRSACDGLHHDMKEATLIFPSPSFYT